ncbi:prostasin [Austrofundulus limnaeus]|uniref:Prostasin n=1 Tax=Austrofundulus limnaeus TaxID=52670 RepID=A0A2I4CP13_AUSLI|nr:PREDICTED: prostasin-like [Austrofundulus limnaeus]
MAYLLCEDSTSVNTLDLHPSGVLLGVYNLTGRNPSKVTRSLSQIICHPEYNEYTVDNDICLLKLSAPVNFTDNIKPICLASADSTFNDGLNIWVTGFGTTGSGSLSNTLQEVKVPIVGNNKCLCYLQGFSKITENMMCAGLKNGGKDSCQGDSGGPLMTQNGFTWVQAGIVSFGDGCALPNRPGVYTRVSQYQKWIGDTVSGMKPGFITFTSPDVDDDMFFTCPTSSHADPFDDSVFSSGENLSPAIQPLTLSGFALFLHVFLSSGGM